ncbi:MAG: MmgE/PrpD family protein [Firmicutes bacterium]|nr:MmgE/PrpD family protein [Bacillota bacterium]
MPTKTLANFTSGLRFEDLPSDVVLAAKQCLLDHLGVALAGSVETSSKIMAKTAAEIMGGTGCNLVTPGFPQASLLQAALVNGAFGHALDMDDVHNAAIIHLAVVTIPAALALGQVNKINGRSFITAVVAGYDIGARIGLAVNPSSYFYWHTTGTVGTFAATATCANILGLTPDQTVHAFGSAGTQAAGLWEFLSDGAMSKFLHTGKACVNGIISAQLAKNGYTAATRILEGEKGFIRAVAPEPNFDVLTKDLGKPFKILENSFKPYPSCKHTHPSIYATQKIIEETGVKFQDVKNIMLKVYSVAENLVGNKEPKTPYGAKFSLPYCVSAALYYGEVGIRQFREDTVNNPEVQALMKRVDVVVDEEIEKQYQANPNQWTQQVEITTKDGKTLVKRIDFPKGDPENPFTFEETVTKFHLLTADLLPEEQRNRLVEKVIRLESLGNISELFAI